MFNSASALEKLAHAYQLLEIWHRTSQVNNAANFLRKFNQNSQYQFIIL
jgi:hypothetical protein